MTEKPRRFMILGGGHSAAMAALLIQSQMAQRTMVVHHEKLIASGHEWDGLDGYVAPAGFTEEDSKRMWAESVKEAKDD